MDLREALSPIMLSLTKSHMVGYIFHRLGNTVILYTQGQYIAASKHAFPQESEVVPAYSHSYVKPG